ncbi:flagellar biosynthesis protein FlhA [Arthrobacter sp. Hiyo8]|nr:flagellar biosynthesis protein FlhA [Arthrobacter sp. Hiyo8]
MLNVIMIDPLLEQSMLEDMRPAEGGTQIVMSQARLDAVLASVQSSVEAAANAGRQAVLVCARRCGPPSGGSWQLPTAVFPCCPTAK